MSARALQPPREGDRRARPGRLPASGPAPPGPPATAPGQGRPGARRGRRPRASAGHAGPGDGGRDRPARARGVHRLPRARATPQPRAPGGQETAWTRAEGSAQPVRRAGSLTGLEDEHGDVARGPLVVVVEAGVQLVDLLPQPRPLLALGHPGANALAPAADLDLGVGVGLEVVGPGGARSCCRRWSRSRPCSRRRRDTGRARAAAGRSVARWRSAGAPGRCRPCPAGGRG